VPVELAGAAFLMGLLGGVHCVGMCGGIVSALVGAGGEGFPRWKLRLGYNLGRIASYATAGAVAGTVGGASLLLARALPVQMVALVIANVLLIGLGLYLAGFSNLVVRLEGPGRWIWRYVQPLTRRLLPADTWWRALALGGLWGWLPCGLVYSILATALLASSAPGGAAVMIAFGLGTLPNLLMAGAALDRLRSRIGIRVVAGGLVAGFGLLGLLRATALPDAIRRGVLCLV
jgi:sulfite exporter TauE/SafE